MIGSKALAAALMALMASATVAGCGGGSGSVVPNLPAYTASDPTSAPTAPAPWATISDRRTGVRFSLPHRKKAVLTPSSQPPSWIYQVPVPGGEQNGDELKVSMVFFDGGILDLATSLDNLAAAAAKAGMDDAKRIGPHASRVAGVAAQTGTLTFTDATGQKGYWMTTQFGFGRFGVTAQVYSLSTPAELSARRQQVRQLMHQLLASIRLP